MCTSTEKMTPTTELRKTQQAFVNYKFIYQKKMEAKIKQLKRLVSRVELPDFLDKNGLELASEVLGSDLALEVLARQDALL